MDLTIESLRPGDDRRHHGLMRQAFGGTSPFDPEAPDLPEEQVVAAYDGDELVGSVTTFGFVQTWGGRPVPCGGVSGVAVAPEARGRDAARGMLAESLARMARAEQPVSALYPTTASLYRGMGWEFVGWFEHRKVPVAELRPTGEALAWRRVEHGDPVVLALHDEMAARFDGWFRGDPAGWAYGARRAAREESVNRFTYVGRRRGTDVAAVRYRYESSPASEPSIYDLDVEVICGLDSEAVGAALGLLASHGTTAGHVRTALPPPLLAPHVPQLQRTTLADGWPWMLRIVDPPAAIQARGWPLGVSGRIQLLLVDGVLTANGGPHVLEVDAGEAGLVRGGAGTVTVTAQDLAVLYAGGDVRALADAGRLAEASPADLDLLRAAFTSSPTIPLFF